MPTANLTCEITSISDPPSDTENPHFTMTIKQGTNVLGSFRRTVREVKEEVAGIDDVNQLVAEAVYAIFVLAALPIADPQTKAQAKATLESMNLELSWVNP